MKKFLKKIAIFLILLCSGLIILLNNYGGYLDYFYEKFTTPKQFSMILGDSRAMQGIQPSVLDSCLAKSKYKLPTYNYSFTIAQTSYGPSYLKAIKRKLDTSSYNQLFIITVNPWMLANRTPKLKLESDSIFQNTPPHNMIYTSMKPNLEYFIKNYHYFHFKSIFRRNNKLHKNGWLEENNLPKDKQIFLEWKSKQIEMFNNWKREWRVSEYRLKWLTNTVNYLNKFGEVKLVRLPLDIEILEIENKFWKHFDIDMNVISENTQVDYLNFSASNKWKTYDGHHLDKYGGKLFTIYLSELIKPKK